MQTGNELVQRIPWVWPYNPRSNSFERCPRRVNVVLEKAGERIFARKRPGLVTAQPGWAAGVGQGMTFWNGGSYTVIDDTLNTTFIGDSGSSGATWTDSGAADWQARQLFQAVSVQGTIYVLGGITTAGDALSDVWAITQGQGWQLCTASAPWSKRYGFMAASINDTLYVIGGKDAGSGDILDDVWATTNGTDWTRTVEHMGTGKVAFGTALSAYNGIFILGGLDDGGNLLDNVIFTTDGETWKEVNAAPGWAARKSASAWFFNNAIIIGGGEDVAGTTTFNDVWYSGDGGGTWAQATAAAFSAGLSRAGYTVYADKIWQINGWNGSAGTNSVYWSVDAVTWITATTNGPSTDSSGGQVIVFPTLTAISPYNYQTMYWLGGSDSAGTTCNNEGWRADLDTTLSSSTAIPNVPIADQRFQFNSFVEGTKLLLKNESGMWVVDGGDLIQVTDGGYPVETVPGIVVLGGFAYVMDPSGLIRNCDIDDPYHWPSLNAVAADYEDDHGVALVKYLNYAVAFGTYTMQFFYDAGSPVGSPLKPYLAGNMAIGCADANSIVQLGGTVVWVSRTQQGRRQVMIFDGLTPRPISTWQIEEFIAEWIGINAYAVQVPGHMVYVIWTDDAVPALAFDFTTGEWTEWTNSQSTNLPLAMNASCSTESVLFSSLALDPSNGKVYAFSNSLYGDDGVAFTVMLITDKVDNANNRTKFWGQFEVIADMNTGTPSISWSDDDWQTFSAARTVDMSTQRPVLYRNGAGRRRIFKYLQQDLNPARIEALEQTWEQGQ